MWAESGRGTVLVDGRSTRSLDPMKQRPYVLTDMEDRALAACDDMYLETTIARGVLETWYERPIPFRELRQVYSRLEALGLMRPYVKQNSRICASTIPGHRTQDLLMRATAKGREYLTWKRHVG